MSAGISYELKIPLHIIQRWKTKQIKNQYAAIKAYTDYVKDHQDDAE